MTARLALTSLHWEVLSAVDDGLVRFYNGLVGSVLGYAWCDPAIGSISDTTRKVLRDLWVADLIDIDFRALLAEGGYEVVTTTNGHRLLCSRVRSAYRQHLSIGGARR